MLLKGMFLLSRPPLFLNMKLTLFATVLFSPVHNRSWRLWRWTAALPISTCPSTSHHAPNMKSVWLFSKWESVCEYIAYGTQQSPSLFNFKQDVAGLHTANFTLNRGQLELVSRRTTWRSENSGYYLMWVLRQLANTDFISLNSYTT